jgi:hypothetical protein
MVTKGTELVINSRGDTHIVTNAFASPLVSRQQFFRLGKGFNGDRDYYQVLGYDLEPEVDDFLSRYTRDDIAGRIVDLPAQDTWKKRPILIDDKSRSDDEEPTSEFIKAWQMLTDTDGDEAINAYHYFERIDRLSGIGRFGVLIIGVRDGKKLDEPFEGFQGGKASPQDILYLRACSEASVMINPGDIDRDPQSRRFGKPLFYSINIDNTYGGVYSRVHWSRCIHVAEDLLEDEVFGRPRLERILNRLDDIMKIVGGSAEATWKLMRKGLAVIAREGYQMPQDTTVKNEFNSQLEEYDHGLRRVLRLAGVDIEELGSQVVDPSGLFDIIISLIAAASDIPKRILIGSERGELASTQDERAWARVIANRQTNFAEPTILRAFINWCIKAKVLPPPTKGKYKVEWPKLYELTEKEESEVALNLARAILAFIQATGAVDVVSPETFLEKIMKLPVEGRVTEEEETEEDTELFEEMNRNGNGAGLLPAPVLPGVNGKG